MSLEKYKMVDMKLLGEFVKYMAINAEKPMPSFDDAGWFMCVKIIKCNDAATLNLYRKAQSKTL